MAYRTLVRAALAAFLALGAAACTNPGGQGMVVPYTGGGGGGGGMGGGMSGNNPSAYVGAGFGAGGGGGGY